MTLRERQCNYKIFGACDRNSMDSARLLLMEELPENNTTRNFRIIFLKGYLEVI